MVINLYNFRDYRAYLSEALPTRGQERGSRVKLADTIGVQKGFISAVLHGKAELSLEQAFRVSHFLAHTSEEREYFLLLIQRARAGSQELSGFFDGKIEEIQVRRQEIRERINVKADLSGADELTYYSSWHYTGVHMCLMIPSLRSPASMSQYLGLPLQQIVKILEFFVKNGLAEQQGSSFVTGATRMHLPATSPLVAKHHTNWRIQAIQSLDRDDKTDLHYSSVMSISRGAAENIKKILLDSIEAIEPTIRQARDESVHALTMDLFELGRN